jgi:2-oxoisovalerate dehydrogenase E1 component alpha subunit
VVVDGNDVCAVHRAVSDAAGRARRGEGPTLIEAKTYRPVPHSSDDDDRSYRSREEVEEWKKRDPIVLFRRRLEEAGLLTPAAAEELDARAVAEVEDAVKFGEAAPFPPLEVARGPVYAPADEDHG